MILVVMSYCWVLIMLFVMAMLFATVMMREQISVLVLIHFVSVQACSGD